MSTKRQVGKSQARIVILDKINARPQRYDPWHIGRRLEGILLDLIESFIERYKGLNTKDYFIVSVGRAQTYPSYLSHPVL